RCRSLVSAAGRRAGAGGAKRGWRRYPRLRRVPDGVGASGGAPGRGALSRGRLAPYKIHFSRGRRQCERAV
ncbi:hypothetical protein EVAR_72959_1, partial [Eumeta japonica]